MMRLCVPAPTNHRLRCSSAMNDEAVNERTMMTVGYSAHLLSICYNSGIASVAFYVFAASPSNPRPPPVSHIERLSGRIRTHKISRRCHGKGKCVVALPGLLLPPYVLYVCFVSNTTDQSRYHQQHRLFICF